MKKTFEFTEQEAELLRKEQYKYLINDNIDHFLLLVQQIVSERITPEPGESGQSAEDVIKYLEMSVDGRAYSTMIRAVISNHLKTHPEKLPIELVLDIYNAMRLHASQVCAYKDREKEYDIHMDATIECVGCDYRHSRRYRVDVPINSTMKESRCPKCGEPSFVVMELDGKLKKQGIQYGKTLSEIERPEVVVPSEKKDRNDYEAGWNRCLDVIKDLNPTITFTELNHEK